MPALAPLSPPDAHSLDADPDGRGTARPTLDAIVAAFSGSRPRFHVICDPGLRLAAGQLDPMGAIVSEAISNAVRHAFPDGREGDVWVRLTEAEGRATLVVRDNGVGMPDPGSEPHPGRNLIERLARQLGGYARLGSANFGGAEVTVVFPNRG